MYKTMLKIAYQSMLERRGRTILLVLMIGLSMGTMVALEGLYDGMTQRMIDKAMRSDSGAISLYAPNYRLKQTIAYRINDADTICQTLRNLPEVDDARYRIRTDGLIQTAKKSRSAILLGINLHDENRFGNFKAFVQSGHLVLGKNDALIGSELAKKLKVAVGSHVTFATQDRHNNLQSISLHITAVVRTSNMVFDARALYVARNTAVALLDTDAHSATQIAISSHHADVQKLKEKIARIYPRLSVHTFTELYPQLKQMQALMSAFNGITFFIVMIVVFIGILGVMYVNILDRIREFGILLSIGYSYRYIRLQTMLESLILGFFGYMLGVLVGWILLGYLHRYGLNLNMFGDAAEFFGMDTVVYAAIKGSYFVYTWMAIMFASVLSIWLPLRNIKKLNPIEVVRSIA